MSRPDSPDILCGWNVKTANESMFWVWPYMNSINKSPSREEEKNDKLTNVWAKEASSPHPAV